jgi:hypothetical protein
LHPDDFVGLKIYHNLKSETLKTLHKNDIETLLVEENNILLEKVADNGSNVADNGNNFLLEATLDSNTEILI